MLWYPVAMVAASEGSAWARGLAVHLAVRAEWAAEPCRQSARLGGSFVSSAQDAGLRGSWALLLFRSLMPSVAEVLVQHPAAVPSLCLPRQLMENQIGVVERGAFDDMKELERL